MKQNVFRKVLSSDVSKWICWQICTACACDINHTSWLKWHHGAFSLSRQVRWDLCAATEKMQIAMQLLTVINTINLLIWTNACAEFYHPACGCSSGYILLITVSFPLVRIERHDKLYALRQVQSLTQSHPPVMPRLAESDQRSCRDVRSTGENVQQLVHQRSADTVVWKSKLHGLFSGRKMFVLSKANWTWIWCFLKLYSMYCHTLPCCALPLLLHKFIISSLLITTASLNNKYPLLREHVFVCANPRQLFPVSVSRHRFWGHITIQRQFKRHGLRLRRWFIAFPGIKKSIKTKILSTPVFHCLHFISLPSISPFCRAVQSRQVYSFHPWARWVTCSKSQPTYFTILYCLYCIVLSNVFTPTRKTQ